MMIDSVHNYYERLIIQEIKENYGSKLDEDSLADMACLALNKMEPRYIRYDIDMSFYLTPSERIEIENKISTACEKAYKLIMKFRAHEALKDANTEEVPHNHGHDTV